MRLINEDDVLEIVERVTNEAVEKKQPKYLIQPRIIAEIAGLPTIEAQPVKRGRWEHGECSVCGASPLDHVSGDMYVEVDYYPNYCPSCGSQNVDLWLNDDSVPNEDMRPDNESI